MLNSQDSPNPLRPYYRRPSIGISQDIYETTSAGPYGLGLKNVGPSSYASSARDIFSDINYTDYLSETSPTVLESTRKQIDEWFFRYINVLLAQPFDVAKMVLQARSQDLEKTALASEKINLRRTYSQDSLGSDCPSDDSDLDELAYFTSSTPYSKTQSRSREPIRTPSSVPDSRQPLAHQLVLKTTDSILEVASQEWTKEGARGLWKGTNVTFIYGFLLETMEKWSRSLLLAILNLPDPVLTSGIDIPGEIPALSYPWASFAVSITAAIMAGVILAPLDIIRTKLMLTPKSNSNRSLMSQIRSLNSYLCHPTVLLPTMLHSLVTPAISYSASLIFRSHLSIDPILSPSSYCMAQFVSRSVELYLKLPLETVLRRAQMSVLKQESRNRQKSNNQKECLLTTVPIGEYRGVFGTMWLIVNEEGIREAPKSQMGRNRVKAKKGQGLSGLWRGWRIGMWGLVGVWGSRALNGGSGGDGEF
ncbi:hypothetical protein K3495_g5844 [Podosphaera aphanis]|nr:hypothetical protein K3495_g5844 [Podosphaera aphanis]